MRAYFSIAMKGKLIFEDYLIVNAQSTTVRAKGGGGGGGQLNGLVPHHNYIVSHVSDSFIVLLGKMTRVSVNKPIFDKKGERSKRRVAPGSVRLPAERLNH